MKIQNRKIMVLVFVCLISLNSLLALGVNSPYWTSNPLEMYPGETRDVFFTLVEKSDSEIVQAFATLEDGAGIAKIISGEEYTVIPGTTSAKVILQIKIPKKANIGDSYEVMFSVGAASAEQGTVQLDLKYDVKFPVQVVEKSEISLGPKDKKIGMVVWFIFIALVLVIFVLIIFLIIRKRTSKTF